MNRDLSETRFQRNPEVVWRRQEEKLLMFDPVEGKIHVINPTGATIWELCDGEHSVLDIIKSVKEKFEVADEKKIKEDVVEFVEGLQEKGFLSPVARKENV